MDLRQIIMSTRAAFDGFNLPASRHDISELQRFVGTLPEEVVLLYEDHNGSDRVPQTGESRLAVRLMPISEVIETNVAMMAQDNGIPKVGAVTWLWADDSSNYCGIYTDGPLCRWLCILDHEEPMLTPAFRSIASFMDRLLAESVRGDGQQSACDLPAFTREIPASASDSANAEQDRQLASLFLQRYKDEADEDLRRLCAFCSICLTPFEDTAEVMAFLNDEDMWTPEAAIRLLELRRWREGVEHLEKLAREGGPNADTAAMRLLVRMDTNQSREAIARLKSVLQGRKLQSLQMWVDRPLPLRPPRW